MFIFSIGGGSGLPCSPLCMTICSLGSFAVLGHIWAVMQPVVHDNMLSGLICSIGGGSGLSCSPLCMTICSLGPLAVLGADSGCHAARVVHDNMFFALISSIWGRSGLSCSPLCMTMGLMDSLDHYGKYMKYEKL